MIAALLAAPLLAAPTYPQSFIGVALPRHTEHIVIEVPDSAWGIRTAGHTGMAPWPTRTYAEAGYLRSRADRKILLNSQTGPASTGPRRRSPSRAPTSCG